MKKKMKEKFSERFVSFRENFKVLNNIDESKKRKSRVMMNILFNFISVYKIYIKLLKMLRI